MDYSIPVNSATFQPSDSNGATVTINVTVNSDDIIEWDEVIVIDLVDPAQHNIVLSNYSQVMTMSIDQDGN